MYICFGFIPSVVLTVFNISSTFRCRKLSLNRENLLHLSLDVGTFGCLDRYMKGCYVCCLLLCQYVHASKHPSVHSYVHTSVCTYVVCSLYIHIHHLSQAIMLTSMNLPGVFKCLEIVYLLGWTFQHQIYAQTCQLMHMVI